MELTGMFPTLRRWGLVIVVSTVLAALVGLALSSSADETYEAKAELLIGPLSTDTDTIRASGTLAQTYAELATSRSILDVVSEQTDVPMSELRSGVRVSANPATRFVTVRARSGDAQTAATAANAVTEELIRISELDQTRPEGRLRLIDPAREPSSPISPKVGLIVPLAAVAGLLGAITLVLLFDYVNDGVETAEKVEAATDLATVSLVERRQSRATFGLRDELAGQQLDRYRLLATQVELAATPMSCVLVVGTGDDDGSGVVAFHLAKVLADRRELVVLVDAADGEVTDLAEMDELPGLSDLLISGRNAATAPFSPPGSSVLVLPRGVAGSVESLRARDADRIVDEVAAEGGVLVVHGSPPSTSSATLRWAAAADATIVGVRRSQARRKVLGDVVRNLRLVGANLVVAVLHDARHLEHGRGAPAAGPSGRSATQGPRPEGRAGTVESMANGSAPVAPAGERS